MSHIATIRASQYGEEVIISTVHRGTSLSVAIEATDCDQDFTAVDLTPAEALDAAKALITAAIGPDRANTIVSYL